MFRHQRGNQAPATAPARGGHFQRTTFTASPPHFRTPPSSRYDARYERPRRFHLGSAVMADERAALQRAH